MVEPLAYVSILLLYHEHVWFYLKVASLTKTV
jgi:hypothetical protein